MVHVALIDHHRHGHRQREGLSVSVPELPEVLDTASLCPADTNGDGEVDVQDLILVILAWGPCP